MQEASEELRRRGLVETRDQTRPLTREGCAVFSRLAAARRERLAELFSDWPAEKHEELAALIARLAREIVPDAAAVPELAAAD